MNVTEVVIIDDNIKDSDPLILELEQAQFAPKVFNDSNVGLKYILDNLQKRIVVILDIQLGSDFPDGKEVLSEIRRQTKLLPVIIWSAQAADFNTEYFQDFINNHALFYVNQTAPLLELINRVKEADSLLKLDVSTAIENWLEEVEDKSQTMIYSNSGKKLNAQDIIGLIRSQSDEGIELQENILKLTIDLLFRNKEKI